MPIPYFYFIIICFSLKIHDSLVEMKNNIERDYRQIIKHSPYFYTGENYVEVNKANHLTYQENLQKLPNREEGEEQLSGEKNVFSFPPEAQEQQNSGNRQNVGPNLLPLSGSSGLTAANAKTPNKGSFICENNQ